MWERGFVQMRELQRAETYATAQTHPDLGYYRGLHHLNIGILGVGQMGLDLAKTFKVSCKWAKNWGYILRCFFLKKFFGSCVWGLGRSKNPSNLKVCKLFDYDLSTEDEGSISKILQNCDYICNVLPKTPQTNDILGNDIMKHCKKVDKGNAIVNLMHKKIYHIFMKLRTWCMSH